MINLERERDVMNAIAEGVYQLELGKIMGVIENSQKESGKEGCNIYAMLKNIKNCSDILRWNVDIMIYNGKLYVSKINKWDHVRICGKEEIAKKFLVNFSEPVLFCDEKMDRSQISDLIENDSLVCITENYLQDYLFKATNQHDGLRKRAVIKLLNHLEGKNIDETLWVKELWDYIREKRKQLIEKLYAKMSKGILWLKKEYIRDEIEAKEEYFIVFKSSWVERSLDNKFCDILQNYINEKSVEHIISIRKE